VTPEEQKVMDLLVDAWNKYITLPIIHPDENTEFRHNFHNLQRVLISRDYIKKQGIQNETGRT
jgi:hypothetical protein